MISKGTLVTIKTNNGGLITGVLDHNYRPSYAVTIILPHGYVTILSHRIVAVVER